MLDTNHSWDRGGTETQPDFVAIIENRQPMGSHQHRFDTGEPVGGTL